jgi:hypothetical protein
MSKHLPKLIWTLAFVLGLFLLVRGFALKTKTNDCDANSTEKCSDSKVQSGLSIKNLSHHILDFNR